MTDVAVVVCSIEVPYLFNVQYSPWQARRPVCHVIIVTESGGGGCGGYDQAGMGSGWCDIGSDSGQDGRVGGGWWVLTPFRCCPTYVVVYSGVQCTAQAGRWSPHWFTSRLSVSLPINITVTQGLPGQHAQQLSFTFFIFIKIQKV